MSKRIQKILAAQAAEEEDKDKPEEAAPVEETPAAEDEAAPVEEAPPEAPAEEPAPVEDTPEEEKKDEEEEAECGDEKQAAAFADRLAALEARFAAIEEENARMKAALSDPAFAAAAAKATTVPAGADAAQTLSRDAANAEYAKLKTPREKAAFRAAHRAELGLR